jgi:hypothetical protein
VLLIAEDRKSGEIYRRVLEFVGYEVIQALDVDDISVSSISEPEVVVICNLPTVAYPDPSAPVIRIPEGAAPDVVVTEVFRRVAPRPTLDAIRMNQR